ncbi:hypothetical protein L1887_53541 [Cichorium endivia]|nr:hypothetical protein L1887_53541 [Cichorium endivia]
MAAIACVLVARCPWPAARISFSRGMSFGEVRLVVRAVLVLVDAQMVFCVFRNVPHLVAHLGANAGYLLEDVVQSRRHLDRLVAGKAHGAGNNVGGITAGHSPDDHGVARHAFVDESAVFDAEESRNLACGTLEGLEELLGHQVLGPERGGALVGVGSDGHGIAGDDCVSRISQEEVEVAGSSNTGVGRVSQDKAYVAGSVAGSVGGSVAGSNNGVDCVSQVKSGIAAIACVSHVSKEDVDVGLVEGDRARRAAVAAHDDVVDCEQRRRRMIAPKGGRDDDGASAGAREWNWRTRADERSMPNLKTLPSAQERLTRVYRVRIGVVESEAQRRQGQGKRGAEGGEDGESEMMAWKRNVG